MLCLLSEVRAYRLQSDDYVVHIETASRIQYHKVGTNDNNGQTQSEKNIYEKWYQDSNTLVQCKANNTLLRDELYECRNPQSTHSVNFTDLKAGSFVPWVKKDLTLSVVGIYTVCLVVLCAWMGFQLSCLWTAFAIPIMNFRCSWKQKKALECFMSIFTSQQREERLELGRYFSVWFREESERYKKLFTSDTPQDKLRKDWSISREILRYQNLFDWCGRLFLSEFLWIILVYIFIDLDSIWNDIVVVCLIVLHMWLIVWGYLCIIRCDRQFVAMMPKGFCPAGDDHCPMSDLFLPFLLLCLTSINLKEAIQAM